MTQTPQVRTKASSALLDFEFVLARASNPWLASGEVITSLQIVEATGGLSISSVTNTGSSGICWVGGGVPNARYTVDCAFVTNMGRKDVRSVDFVVESRMY